MSLIPSDTVADEIHAVSECTLSSHGTQQNRKIDVILVPEYQTIFQGAQYLA
jgi:hypothetical protein